MIVEPPIDPALRIALDGNDVTARVQYANDEKGIVWLSVPGYSTHMVCKVGRVEISGAEPAPVSYSEANPANYIHYRYNIREGELEVLSKS